MTGRCRKHLGVKITDVTPEHIAAFLAPYSGRPFQKHGLYRAIKSLYRWLKKMRRISENPMEFIETPKVPEGVLNIVTPDQVRYCLKTPHVPVTRLS